VHYQDLISVPNAEQLSIYHAIIDSKYCLLFIDRQVLEVLAAVRNEDAVELGETVYQNTRRLFRF